MRQLILTLVLITPAIATAVPLKISHQGRLFDDTGTPLDGPHTVEISLFDAPTAGTSVWSDSFAGVSFDNGYYALVLGSGLALDAEDFDGEEIFVELAIDSGSPVTTRLPLDSVPYAFLAHGVSGGIVDATEVRIDGTTVIDSTGTIAGASDTLASLSCTTDQLARFDGAAWVCADLDGSHLHDAADISTGILDISRIPVGTDSTMVAAGDHSHDAASIISGTLAYDRLPVGTGSDNVAVGDHTHDPASIGALAAGGGIPVGAESASCSRSNVGTIRLESNLLQWCDGNDWAYLTPPPGQTQEKPAASCKEILDEGWGTADGKYWIDPNDTGAFEVSCDMTTDGGGWTVLEPCDALHHLGGALDAIVATTGTANFDTSCRPRTRDNADYHFYHYDFDFGAGFTEFILHNWEASANAGSGYTSEFGIEMSDWTTVGTVQDIAYGGANQAAPADTYVANGQTGTCENCTFPWPGTTDAIAVGASDTAFRMGWSERGSEHEGWYPWFTGQLKLR